MDIQPVFNYYKAVSCMFPYFSKLESATSQALIQLLKVFKCQAVNARESVYNLASTFATSMQISLQEVVH